MIISYRIDRFMAENGALDVTCWPTENPAIVEHFTFGVLSQDGTIPDKDTVLAKIEAALPISWLEMRVAQLGRSQPNLEPIFQEVGKTRSCERLTADQGRILAVSVLGA